MTNAGAVSAENVQVTRLYRKLDDVARPRRDPARCNGDQQLAGTFACDVRLIAEPLIGNDAHADTPRSDRDPLRPNANPHARCPRERLLRYTVERVASKFK